MRRIRNLKDVVDWGLCTGCGACASVCSKPGIRLVNIEGVGIRPKFDSDECAECSACLSVCPGYQVDGRMATGPKETLTSAENEFGSVLEIWEGYATDPEIRHRASSGGALSGLALYCLERGGMEFVLHSAADPVKPWLNRTVKSKNREEIIGRTGSRYAPASPCDGLKSIEDSERPCVFIGKPCDTAAAFKMRAIRPALDQKLGLVLSFFCAGTPSTRGTLDLVTSLDFQTDQVRTLHYRGQGWPGRFTVGNGDGSEKSLSYSESWGALTKYRPQRCHICPDGLGRIADISCGDAWDKFEENGDPGRSLILVRTPRGQEVLRRAIDAGYVSAVPTNAAQVLSAQSNLLARRREIFGRLLGMKLLGVPSPRLDGFSLLRSWLTLPLKTQARTIAGTMTRLVQKGRWRRQPVF